VSKLNTDSKPILVHGHRGSRGTSPENIITSFAEAYAVGCEFIEFDVHLSKDDCPIVFHDDEISGKLCRDFSGKPVDRPIPIRSLTLKEIQSFEIGTLLLPNFPEQKPMPGGRIPTLEELIQWKLSSAPKMSLNLEIKREDVITPIVPSPELLARSVMPLLEKYNLVASTLVQSFDHEVVSQVRRINSQVKLSCLFEKEADFASEVLKHKAQVAAIHYSLINQGVVANCFGTGVEVLPWTANDAEEWRRLINLGVRSIITDYPKKLKNYLMGS
jgi:glycerophosphoryl diester phosphodiesterase